MQTAGREGGFPHAEFVYVYLFMAWDLFQNLLILADHYFDGQIEAFPDGALQKALSLPKCEI